MPPHLEPDGARDAAGEEGQVSTRLPTCSQPCLRRVARHISRLHHFALIQRGQKDRWSLISPR
jgi:hypothetical protein